MWVSDDQFDVKGMDIGGRSNKENVQCSIVDMSEERFGLPRQPSVGIYCPTNKQEKNHQRMVRSLNKQTTIVSQKANEMLKDIPVVWMMLTSPQVKGLRSTGLGWGAPGWERFSMCESSS